MHPQTDPASVKKRHENKLDNVSKEVEKARRGKSVADVAGKPS